MWCSVGVVILRAFYCCGQRLTRQRAEATSLLPQSPQPLLCPLGEGGAAEDAEARGDGVRRSQPAKEAEHGRLVVPDRDVDARRPLARAYQRIGAVLGEQIELALQTLWHPLQLPTRRRRLLFPRLVERHVDGRQLRHEGALLLLQVFDLCRQGRQTRSGPRQSTLWGTRQ